MYVVAVNNTVLTQCAQRIVNEITQQFRSSVRPNLNNAEHGAGGSLLHVVIT